jgi:hypothetical protein
MPYTVASIIAAVQDDLKDPSFSSTRILRYINRAQERIFNNRMLKFTETSVTGALTIGEHTYEQQSNHQATIGGVLIDTSDDTVALTLDKDSYIPHRQFFDEYPAPELSDNARPTAWTEYGDQLYFNCPVDKAYSFTQRYYKTPAELTADANTPEVPAAFREILELFCLYRAEKYRGNHDVASTYMQDFEDALEAMTKRFAAPTQVAPARIRQRRVRTGAY